MGWTTYQVVQDFRTINLTSNILLHPHEFWPCCGPLVLIAHSSAPTATIHPCPVPWGVDKQVNLEHMGVSKNSGTPKWMIWGYHYFRKHPYKTRPCAHSQKKRGFFVYKYFVKSTNLKNIIWLVVEPTPLKNMLVKMGSSSPNRGEFFKNIWNHLDNANNLVPRDSIGDPTWSPNGFLLGHDSPLRSGHLRSLKTNYPKKKVTFAELPGLNFYIPKDPGSPKLKIVMEPKYLAFRRWLYTPIIIWEYDDWCL